MSDVRPPTRRSSPKSDEIWLNGMSELLPDEATMAIVQSADIALVLRPDGKIQDAAVAPGVLDDDQLKAFAGSALQDLVSESCRPKVADALAEARKHGLSEGREINHALADGQVVPVRYAMFKLPRQRAAYLALGRDLSGIAALQRRLVAAQQDTERDYARLRLAETRYRVLFHRTHEAVLVIDAANQKIVEINPAAGALLDTAPERAVGRPFASMIAAGDAERVREVTATLKAVGAVDRAAMRLAHGGQPVQLCATRFLHGRSTYDLIRLTPVGSPGDGLADREGLVAAALDATPEAVVICDPDGVIVATNAGFVELVQVASEQAALGRALSEWLGRPGADFAMLAADVAERGICRFFETVVHGALGETFDVEVSGARLAGDRSGRCVYVLRDIGGRLSPAAPVGGVLPGAMSQMRDLVGRVPLKDLVRETTEIVERMCIESALELTRGNRAGAAEMLGLSRQSLYVKLRRYGFVGDEDADADGDGAE